MSAFDSERRPPELDPWISSRAMVFFKTRPRRLGLLLLALACARGASGQRLWTRDDAAAAIALDFALAGDDLPDCAAALQVRPRPRLSAGPALADSWNV
jgi:hypothetical protein